MSVKFGLIKNFTQHSAMSNVVNARQDITDYNKNLSIVYSNGINLYSSKKYYYGTGAGYPFFNKNNSSRSLTKKNFICSVVAVDGKTEQTINPNDLSYEILFSNISSNYNIVKSNESFDIIFNNLLKNRINLTIKITGSEYISTYVQLTAEPGAIGYVQKVGLVNVNNAPDGVSVVTTSLNQNDNGTVQEYVLNFPESSTRLEYSTITIPQGTKFYDADHNVLNGTLSVVAAHFSPSNTTSTLLFAPGWNTPNLMINNQLVGSDGSYNFVSAGFYSIEIKDSNGILAKNITG